MGDENHAYWNRRFKILQDTWPRPLNFEECVGICLELHAMVHTGEMTGFAFPSFEDELLEGLSEESFRRVYPEEQSIAWKLWHSGRIEDITMNMLIADGEQEFCVGGWFEKLGITARDTGNAMNESEIEALSRSVDRQAMLAYRKKVGERTREIIQALKPEDLKKKIPQERLQRVLEEGAVVPEAKGLVDYWGKKTFAGLLLMPATRHLLVHLNEAIRIKK